VEKDFEGNRVHAHGHFEFVLIRGSKRICIVEAKQEQFGQGAAQCLLGCEVATFMRYLVLSPISYSGFF